MNLSCDRLMGLAQETFDQDPLSGHLFLFLNRQRDRIKILFWDVDGFCSERLPPSASPLADRSAASVAGTSGWRSAFFNCQLLPKASRASNLTVPNSTDYWAALT